jgi:hypothetical protein
MATRSIARLYDSYSSAQAAVQELESSGFSHDDVTYMGNKSGQSDAANDAGDDRSGAHGTSSGAGTGATLGTVLGGGAGLLAGLGALAIPGVGPVVAAGWLVAAITGAGVGAAAGGLLGALTGAGLGEEHAETYAEGVRRGGHLVVVRADDSRAMEAERILNRHNPVDMESRTADWRSEGWTGGNAAGMGGTGSGAGLIGAGMGSGMTGTGTGLPSSGTLGTGVGATGPAGTAVPGTTRAPGVTDDVNPVNDPTYRRPGDVA